MSQQTLTAPSPGPSLAKAPTGIQGLDEVTGGGLPRGRPTLICGGAGSGKTLFALEFLVRGAVEYGEPGVFFAFEESTQELTQNVRSLGFDLDALAQQKMLKLEYVRVERSEIEETGEYDLEGLFVRLGYAIDTIGAKRVVLDTLETLFASLSNESILRSELRRLFRWLKDRGVTAVITGEKGDGTFTRHGLEEYVSDCVILLDHRVTEQVSTRRLRVVKYRGTAHGTNEFPFLIDADGITVLPVTSLGLAHSVSGERVSTGIPRLDAMLGGKGYFRGSTLLITGMAGTGKTSIAARFVQTACERNEQCVYFSFEESEGQLVRNMRSIGIDLKPCVDSGRLYIRSVRATQNGLEAHLSTILKVVRDTKPRVVVLDPMDSLVNAGTVRDTTSTLVRLIDYLKSQHITVLLTNLVSGSSAETETGVEVSSLVDTWILLKTLERDGERNRILYVLKSRGMPHSNQVREFLLTDNGIELQDVYVGSDGVLTGSSRLAQEAREAASAVERALAIKSQERELERKREALDARITALRKEFEADSEELQRTVAQSRAREEMLSQNRTDMSRSRKADSKRLAAGGTNGTAG